MISLRENTCRYLRERCPLPVMGLMAVMLNTAPAMISNLPWVTAVRHGLSIFIGLIMLRMVDDLADLPVDRLKHPGRGLVTGEIQKELLRRVAMAGIVLLLLLNPDLVHIAGFVGIGIFYGAFYKFKKYIPIWWHPLMVNIIFMLIPVYAGGTMSRPFVYLAVFVWLGAVAHDFAHSAHDFNGGEQDPVGSLGRTASRRAALLGVSGFGIASVAGLIFWIDSGRPWGFLFTLALMCVVILRPAVRLVRQPDAQNAGLFYVRGFLFFLMPMAGLIVDQLLP
ncbi:MAG: UbiA family prenyltransferase [Desulfobacteraceae bacterium]|nr:UbiA family prenyltransferase [Desulfobacteraceae bacterium]